MAEPAPQETAIKSLGLEWCGDSSPSVGPSPRAMALTYFITEGADGRQAGEADTFEQHRPWLRGLQTPCCGLPDTGGASQA